MNHYELGIYNAVGQVLMCQFGRLNKMHINPEISRLESQPSQRVVKTLSEFFLIQYGVRRTLTCSQDLTACTDHP